VGAKRQFWRGDRRGLSNMIADREPL